MSDIGTICAEAAREWHAWLKADVCDGALREAAVGKAMKAVEATGMPLQAVLDRGEQELRAQRMSEG